MNVWITNPRILVATNQKIQDSFPPRINTPNDGEFLFKFIDSSFITT